MRKVLFFLLFPVVIMAQQPPDRVAALSHKRQHVPPYPILFVHGVNSDNRAWGALIYHLQRKFNWGEETVFHACLNSNPRSTHYLEDVKLDLQNKLSLQNGASRRIFTANFFTKYDARQNKIIPYKRIGLPNQSESHQSAITKQGYALGEMIRRIMALTGAEKVILVGHSMGGLAIREYLQRRDGGNGAKPKWWVNPEDEQNGHHVARVVTLGTPHQGSNMTDLGLLNASGLTPSPASEAVRDLRYSYTGNGGGRFLFGGDERWSPDARNAFFKYNNFDINANGIEGDANILGLNADYDQNADTATARDNPFMPLPANILYTWVRSRNCGTKCTTLGGDGIVGFERQWIQDGRENPMPPSADWIETNKFHTEENSDLFAVIRAMDEPDEARFGYALPISTPQSFTGFSTYQPDYFPNPAQDVDVYTFRPSFSGTMYVSMEEVLAALWQAEVLNLQGYTIGSFISNQPSPETTLRFGVPVSAAQPYQVRMTTPALANAHKPYSFQVEAMPLLHYPPAEGRNFATVTFPANLSARGLKEPLRDGDEIAIFSADGRCLGAGVWKSGLNKMTVAFTPSVETGAFLFTRIWKGEQQEEWLSPTAFAQFYPNSNWTVDRIFVMQNQMGFVSLNPQVSGRDWSFNWSPLSLPSGALYVEVSQDGNAFQVADTLAIDATTWTLARPQAGSYEVRLKWTTNTQNFFSPSTSIEVQPPILHRILGPDLPDFQEETTFRLIVADEQQVRILLEKENGEFVTDLFNNRLAPDTAYDFRVDGRLLNTGRYVVRVIGETFIDRILIQKQ